jgi:heat-inducible transcriptional repressor
MELGDRRRKILTAVVNDYVQTAEPVGSESLVHRYDFGVKPATIRNELAAMSEMGYLRQPHTSAGRVPSDMGYRYYVDELMPDATLEPSETRRAKRHYDPRESEVDDILQQTCRILSGLTRYTSLATPPQMEAVSVKHVALSIIGQGRILVITILNTGHIDHRVLDYIAKVGSSDLMAMGNFLSTRFRDAELNAFSARADQELPSELQRLNRLYRKATGLVKQALANATDDEVYVEGTANILRQPEFSDRDRMASILEALEHRRSLYQTLSTALLGKHATVIIGSENRFDEMRECSFVASSYSIGGRTSGSIGVVGPTRMDYRRAVGAVQFMASNLSNLLTSLSIW